MSDAPQHNKRREWWIKQGEYSTALEFETFYSSVADHPFKTSVHVREVLPGEITITETQLRVALFEARKYEDNGDLMIDQETICANLFGPLPEGTHDGK